MQKESILNNTIDPALMQLFTSHQQRTLGFDDERFRKIKDEKKDGKTNPINYLVDTARVLLQSSQDPEKLSSGTEYVLDNALSMVKEYPVAEATHTDTQRYKWRKKDGEWRIETKFGDMDTILADALISKQTLPFEIPRYIANFDNYQKLKKERSKLLPAGRLTHGRTFIEFSPTPLLSKEAKQRGYFGRSTIFFFDYDPLNGEEIVRQRWLNTEWFEINKLLRDITGKETEGTDVAIMRQSGFFPPEEVARIEEFIDAKNGQIIDRPEISHYLTDVLKPIFESQMRSILFEGARKLLIGEDYSEELSFIESTMAFFQYELKKKISEISSALHKGNYVEVYSSQRDNLYTNADARLLYVKENKIRLSGCGGSTEDHAPYELVAPSLGSMLSGKDKYDSLVFDCPVCLGKHRRNYGKLMIFCPAKKDENGNPIPIPKC